MDKQHIRNFSIIAHIDHGKSTLADRLLLLTGAISEREFHDQFLDEMDLERERGITIKAKAVRMFYHAKDGNDYLLNLIDTPGHVDFTYEVSKSLKACEGALLVVDASQGVEAQTVANLYMALENHLTIIPVVNKIDLPQADTEGVKHQVLQILNLPEEEVLFASAKAGTGIETILEAVVRKIPPPKGDDKNPLQALIFDSIYDPYRGVLVFIRVFNGTIHRGMRVRMMGTEREYEVQELGVFIPHMVQSELLSTGEVGYLAANIREPKDIEVGDTVTDSSHPAVSTLPGYKKVHPMVFCGIYPVNSKDFGALRDAVEKLKLSDASFVSEVESSASLGFGLRCGFLGLLHMDIIQERLERGYDLNLVLTTPSVVYQVQTTKGETLEIDNPTKLPASQHIAEISEPFIRAFLLIPTESVGAVMDLCNGRRGEYRSTEYLSEDRVKLVYQLPLSEVLVDFYDKIKSITRGYGSFDYEFVGYVPGKLVKLDILINGKPCDALSSIVHREKAYAKGKALVEKLKELIPRQLFEVALQAAIGSQIISRETIRSVGKAVTSKCYGGDITRKRKLWEKQKAGKQRMKQFGQVQIPQEAFMAVLKI